jgi:AraC-like DNA-binding protein
MAASHALIQVHMSIPQDEAFAEWHTAVLGGMGRALRATREAPGNSLSLIDLAGIAGVSARTLQRQFRAFLGQTPIETLRAIRLGDARRELLRRVPRRQPRKSRSAAVSSISVGSQSSTVSGMGRCHPRHYGAMLCAFENNEAGTGYFQAVVIARRFQ